ncbi:MAG: stage III sporulation protein AF [Firmicutes bacterium]|nr:stage III sporulation protein AF [Bacillota bacterium]
MNTIGEWLRVLIVVVMLGNLVDFALPKGDLKRYGGLVVGLTILAVMMLPLWQWLQGLDASFHAPVITGYTNSASGFDTVVESEELHQAQAIVMSMPHVVDCQLVPADNGGIVAEVTISGPVPIHELRQYVHAALTVTMGRSSPVTINVVHIKG